MHATRRVWCQALGRLVSIGLLVLGATAAGAAPPEAPTPVAPSGTISGSSYTFTWEAVADATWYYVWLNDASAAPKLAKWYTTAQAHCPEGTGGCFVTLTVGLAPGGARWFVAAYNADGQTWGPAMDFTVASAGTITGVTAGTGLTGGGTSGAVSLAVNTGAIQARVTGACAGGARWRPSAPPAR